MNFIAIFSNYLFYSCKVLIYILNNICLILYFYSYFLLHYIVFFRNRIKHVKAFRREEGGVGVYRRRRRVGGGGEEEEAI